MICQPLGHWFLTHKPAFFGIRVPVQWNPGRQSFSRLQGQLGGFTTQMPRTLGLSPGWQWAPRGHCLFVQQPRIAAGEPVESDATPKIVIAAKLATTIRFVILVPPGKGFSEQPNASDVILLPGVSQDNRKQKAFVILVNVRPRLAAELLDPRLVDALNKDSANDRAR